MFASELIGTALLVLVGLSLVILMFGTGSPIIRVVPSEGVRRVITGFLFGSTGALIALSPIGRESGAHINPAVTLGFWLMGKMDARVAIGYVVAQLIGACLGSLPLLAWGSMGRSVAYGATLPGAGYSTGIVVLGEVVTTFALMVWAESPISGTSTNPARSLGPAIVSGEWQGWWIYWVGPLIGTLVAVVVFSFLAKRITVAKLYYFDSDRHRMFHKAA